MLSVPHWTNRQVSVATTLPVRFRRCTTSLFYGSDSLCCAPIVHCVSHKSGEVDDHQQSGNDELLKKSLGSHPLALGSVRPTFCNADYNEREFKCFLLFYYKSCKKNNVTPCQIRQIIAPGWVICSDRILTILVIGIWLILCKSIIYKSNKSQASSPK